MKTRMSTTTEAKKKTIMALFTPLTIKSSISRWQNCKERPNRFTNKGYMEYKAKRDVLSEIG